MGERIFTPEQSAAIAERKKTLLVSAAAGSGKTATLTERIIASVTDKSDPADIASMLIVTFTRAAASELRTRIGDALRTALEKDPDNRHLAHQLLLLPGAKIKTIDGFCADVVRTGASLIGLSPSFRIADEAERLLLLREVMESFIDDAYAGAAGLSVDGDGFAAFSEELAGARNEDSLSDILLSVVTSTEGYAEGCGRIRSIASRLAKDAEADDPFSSREGSFIRARLTDMLSHYKTAYGDVLASLAPTSRYRPLFTGEQERITAILKATDCGYRETKQLVCDYTLPSLPAIKEALRTPEEEDARALRAAFKSDYEAICKQYFTFSADFFKESLKRTASFAALLYEVLDGFTARFRAEKKRRGLCDYADLEHYTLSILYNEDGTPSAFAEALSRTYDYIYIDEYQDTNSVQHAIFSAIARENNRFMVGDVKQSIYSFRHAEPDIFTSLRLSYPPIEKAENSPNAGIFMSKNFRSDRAVIDFTNEVFDRLFGVAGAAIGYEVGDRLVYGKNRPENGTPVRVSLFSAKQDTDDTSADTDGTEDGDTPDGEIRYLVSEIRRLCESGRLDNGERITPKDIAILLRSGKRAADELADALKNAGIAATAEDSRDFFLNPEILLVLSLLHAIDNPHRDIPLAALLRSPLYGFTADDLVRIRMKGQTGDTLYEALLRYRDEAKDEKAEAFLSELSAFREVSEGIPIDRLLRHLYTETGLYTLAENGKNGKSARKNLLLLYNYARKFEASSFRGLYNFISYVDEIIRRGETIPEAKGGLESGDAVRIMTIHKSKGLEFPVTFLARAGSPFSREDTKKSLLFHGSFGVATRFRDETGLAMVDNPVRRALIGYVAEKNAEEEMRVLYVALTRARERLYVSGVVPHRTDVDKYLSSVLLRRRYFSHFTAVTATSHMTMLLSALSGAHPSYTFSVGDENGEELPPIPTEDTKKAETDTQTVTSDLLRARFDFRYPHAAATALPHKMTVSRLYPDVLDRDKDGTDAPFLTEEKAKSIPRFLSKERIADAAKRGTATHIFMQFCDYERLKTHTAQEELSRLVCEKFMEESDAAIVFLDELEDFRRSALFKELSDAKRIYRELRFHAGFPAAAFTENTEKKKELSDEKVLVQGVTDCVYEREDGSYVLVDYKTDRLTDYELTHREAAEEKLRTRHEEQLSYYAAAATEIFGKPPAATLIYSLPLRDTVTVTPKKLF